MTERLTGEQIQSAAEWARRFLRAGYINGLHRSNEVNRAFLQTLDDLAKAKDELRELRARERTLIDICHAIDTAATAKLSAESGARLADTLERLADVRLWSYPVAP